MSSLLMSLEVGVSQDNTTYTETSFGLIPHGDVHSITIPGQETIITSNKKILKPYDFTKTIEMPMPKVNAEAICNYWRHNGESYSVYRNCHSFAYAGALLIKATYRTHNLLDSPLLLHHEDAESFVDPSNLPPFRAHAVTSRRHNLGVHSILGIEGGLALEVNGSGGNMRLQSGVQAIKAYSGTHLKAIKHLSPAIGTNFWYSGQLNRVKDDRHIDDIISEKEAKN